MDKITNKQIDSATMNALPLKALAWLNLKESKEAGKQIDSRDIKN